MWPISLLILGSVFSDCVVLYLDLLMRHHTVLRKLPAIRTFIHKWNEPYLTLLLSRTASSYFEFPVPLKIGGLVSLCVVWLLHTKVVYPTKTSHFSQY